MYLHDAAHRQGADFDKSNSSEVLRLENIHLTFVFGQDLGLVQQRVPIHGPQASAQAAVIDRTAVVKVVDVMVIHRR